MRSSHDLPEELGLVAPALEVPGLGRSRLPTLEGAPVAIAADRDWDLWRLADQDDPAPRIWRFDSNGDAAPAGPVLAPNSLATSFATLHDGSLVWLATDRPQQMPRWDGGQRTQIFRLRSFEDRPEVLCTVAAGRLFGYLGQSGSWSIWSAAPDIGSDSLSGRQAWGCNTTNGSSRRLTEWEPHLTGSLFIDDRGLRTPDGWLPVEG
jgi:hypothetical protein